MQSKEIPTRSNSVDDQLRRQLRVVIEQLPIETSNQQAWIGLIGPINYHLKTHYDLIDPSRRRVELYEGKDGKNAYIRIYGTPTADHIPTLILGDWSAIGSLAWRDRQPAHPVNGSPKLVEQLSMLVPNDVMILPAISELFAGEGRKLWYYTRPTSYMLTDASYHTVEEQTVMVKTHRNLFDPDATFWHIMTPDEWTPLLPQAGVHGLVVSNSAGYVESHPELNFFRLLD